MSPSIIALSAALALFVTGRSLAPAQTDSAPRTQATIGAPKVNTVSALSNDDCSFSQGTTICTSTNQYTTTSTHAEISGCIYFPTGLPGVRTRTFEDTYLVTVTTTTFMHGKSGPVYDTHTDVTRALVSSRQISDVCAPI